METTEQRLLNRFKELDERPDSELPSKSILILSTPRSGSSLYCDVLSEQNLVGECAEWFNMRYISAYAQLKGIKNINFNEYLNFIKRKTCNNTGVLAVNTHIEQCITLLNNKLDITKFGFDSVIYLNRKDKIAQAISLTKAQITDKWSSDTKAKHPLPDRTPLTKITNSLLHLVNSHEYYLEHLQSLCDFEYNYEDFRSLTEQEFFSQPLEKLGLTIPEAINLKASRKVQSDQTSKTWALEYKEFIGC